MAAAALDVIAAACERMRRLPASRWQLPPIEPLGSRPPDAPLDTAGPTLEMLVRQAALRLMRDDAAARGEAAFEPTAGALALPDVLLALSISVALRGDAGGNAALADVARDARHW